MLVPKTAISPYLVGNQLRASPPQKLAYSIPEFLAAVPIGRTKLYEELKAGRLRAVKVGTPGRRSWCEREIRDKVERSVAAGEHHPRAVAA